MKKAKAIFYSYNDSGESCTADEVIVDDEPVDTGLLDHLGNPIFRTTEKLPMGFHIK